MMALLMMSPLALGVRHMLAVYPCLAVWASSWFRGAHEPRARSVLALVFGLLLLGCHAVESIAARPDYLAYFNSFARGREHKVLGDSNLDWGQDLHRLARYAESHGIDKLHLDYFGATSPAAVGLGQAEPFGPQDRPRGWVAISVTHLQGIYQPAPAWLEGREPHAKIGKSIRLFYVD